METESNRHESVSRCFSYSPYPTEDHMGMLEMEAAEALAGLANFAEAESASHDGPPLSHSVKDETPVPETSDQDVVSQQQSESLCRKTTINVKTEQEVGLLKQIVPCSTDNSPLIGSKPRQNLTEAEKEERRIRRVLANRESARQTIRRRQAFYEELTKKATRLTFENENLRKDIECAAKEFECLKSRNEWLKTQMENRTEMEAHQTPIVPNSATTIGTTIPPSNSPFLMYNHLGAAQIFCQGAPQSSTPTQLHTGYGQDSVNGGGVPLYFLPYPCFFPHPDQGNQRRVTHSLDLNYEPARGSSMEDQSSASSSSHSIAGEEDTGNFLLPRKVKSRSSNSVNSFVNAPQGFSPNGKCQEEMMISESWPKTTGDLSSSQSGKQVDTVGATEARKRRKEVTKLKKFYYRSSPDPLLDLFTFWFLVLLGVSLGNLI